MERNGRRSLLIRYIDKLRTCVVCTSFYITDSFNFNLWKMLFLDLGECELVLFGMHACMHSILFVGMEEILKSWVRISCACLM